MFRRFTLTEDSVYSLPFPAWANLSELHHSPFQLESCSVSVHYIDKNTAIIITLLFVQLHLRLLFPSSLSSISSVLVSKGPSRHTHIVGHKSLMHPECHFY